ncbi:unnamed protein product [Ambrosiozyma monospora]|uniref:Unnamed protein product n=1 Tax=Ambrosiozyma monospora TaxID=43982 RepID=A0ACB5TB46_AMBMO|nr:unnamed protein product [Ambrosiozyma monospora]
MSSTTTPKRIPIEGSTGYGLMSLTWTSPDKIIPQEQAFETINNALADGVRFFNSGEFYGTGDPHLNLKYLRAYFEKYPKNRSKMIISVKGSVDLTTLAPDNSPENIKKSIENIVSYFPNNYIDLFEPARQDLKHSVEDVVKAIIPFIEAGKVGGISLSEVKGETIERANKIYPISCVEVEFSMWATEPLTNGTNDVCRKNGVPIIGYSPLGRGFLTGNIKSTADIDKGSILNWFGRFKDDETIKANYSVVELVTEYAKSKGVSNAQIALAWIRKHNDFPEKYARFVPIPSSSNPKRNHENNTVVELTDAEFDAINEKLSKLKFIGSRYTEAAEQFLNV